MGLQYKQVLSYIRRIFLGKKNEAIDQDTSNLYMVDKTGINVPLLSELPDEELLILNNLLPWASFLTDEKGRKFGKAYSEAKRNTIQEIPDYRTSLLDNRFGLAGKTVLEAGCFEGLHTVSLVQKGAIVTAFDSRIENIVKTMVRCGAFNANANVCYWNLEEKKPSYIKQYDIVHHVGVLYHLRDPIQHLEEICDCVKQTLLLDTHVALDEVMSSDTYKGFSYRYWKYEECGRAIPFAGMEEYARWVFMDDLIAYIKSLGFRNVETIEQRAERNGTRILVIADR